MHPEPISRRAAVKLGLAGLAAAGAGEALTHHATGAEPATSGESEPPRSPVPHAGRRFGTSAGATRCRTRSRARPCQGPAHAGDLAAGDRRRRHGRRSPSPLRLEDGTALDLPALHGAGQDARRQVPQGDAVQQHPLPARPGALGGRAAPRRAPAARQGRRTSAGSTTGASTTTTRSSSSSRRWRSTRCWRRRRASCRRSSPTGSTASRSRSSAAGRCGWSCPGRTGSSRSSGSSTSS